MTEKKTAELFTTFPAKELCKQVAMRLMAMPEHHQASPFPPSNLINNVPTSSISLPLIHPDGHEHGIQLGESKTKYFQSPQK